MFVNQVFAGTAVADFDAALAWYERFVGRPPDLVPQRNEAVWQVTETGWVYIVVDDAVRTGGGLLTLMVDDLEAWVAGLGERGIITGAVDWVVPGSTRSAWVTDPEGNRIQIAEVLSDDT